MVAVVIGPWQLTFPWEIMVFDQEGKMVDSLGLYRADEKEKAEERARKFNDNNRS